MKRFLFLITALVLTASICSGQDLYEIKKGKVTFQSNAPLEEIVAQSSALSGLMNLDVNSFAFTIEIESFKGFNSDLQQEHFYENYLETDVYPRAIFTGKLIDKFDPNASTQKLRSKGMLEIHGVKKERIIEVIITKKGVSYHIESSFNVLLVDHNINIPKIVFQKIAENIHVNVKGEMAKK
jgi:YceI-like domain